VPCTAVPAGFCRTLEDWKRGAIIAAVVSVLLGRGLHSSTFQLNLSRV
jgi:hypothetical protein